MEISVERSPSKERLEELGVLSWPIWAKEVSSFPWSYDVQETCYLLEGQVRVEPAGGGEAVELGAGDLVVFHEGLECTWIISEPVRKHYTFG